MPTVRADKDKQPGPGHLPWAAHVFVRVIPDRVYSLASVAEGLPLGYVLMQKIGNGGYASNRLLWSFRQSFDQTPLQTALYAVEQSLGIKIGELSRVKQIDRLIGTKRFDAEPESHWKYLFCADISETEYGRVNMRLRYEDTYPFPTSTEDFLTLVAQGNLFEPQRSWLERWKLIPEEKFRMAS